jgi:reactive intermediate/imine deaminase
MRSVRAWPLITGLLGAVLGIAAGATTPRAEKPVAVSVFPSPGPRDARREQGIRKLQPVSSGAASQPAEGRRYVRTPSAAIQAPFSEGVLVGDTLWIAGRLGLDAETGKPPAEVEQEARLVMDSLRAVLAEAGMAMDDLVSVQVFCSDVSLYEEFNRVYRTYFPGSFPARAFIGSGPLLRGARFEVQGVAVRRP